MNEHNQIIKKELLIVMARQKPIFVMGIFLFIAFIYCFFLYNDIPNLFIILWFISIASILLFRQAVLWTLSTQESRPTDQRLKLIFWYTLVGGVVNALSLVFFSYYTFVEVAMITLILLALTTGSLGNSIGYRPFFLAFNIPILGTLSIMWAITPFEDVSLWMRLSIALLISLYFFYQHNSANNYFNFFKDTIETKNQLNKALKQSIAASESKTRFLASASHDLRQPIHALQLFSNVLSTQPLNEKSKEVANHMEISIKNLASQMDSLLDISKLDAGLALKNCAALDLNDFMERIKNDMQPLATQKKLALSFIGTDTLATTKTDYEQLDRVIRNLVSNAIKYTEEGNIQLTLSNKKNHWELAIQDTGIGISEEQQKYIFEEFYQVGNKERNRTKGLGLGLSIVKRLCLLLDIEIKLQSTLGIGTTITLILEKSSETIIEHQTEDDSFSIAGLKVLCIDDEFEIRRAIKSLLEGMECEVYIVSNIDELMSALRYFKPNILLADFRLVGEETGIDAIHKAREQLPHLPAILISGDTAPERLKQAAEANLDILHKPVEAKLLQKTIYQEVNS